MKFKPKFSIRAILLLMLLVALFFGFIWNPMPSVKQVGEKNVVIRSWMPIRSIMFDAQYSLVSTQRIPEWMRWVEDEPFTNWSVCEIHIRGFYEENYKERKPEFMILQYPVGYRYYAIDYDENGKMSFRRKPMSQAWKKALARSK